MTATDPVPFHVGITPERVVDAAEELTRDTHLMTWSIRDLAGRLGIAASGVYHHVGGKDSLCREVVERVLARIEVPDLQLTWQEWFRTLLFQAGPVVAEYPGVAKWMLMHGPTLPAALPVLEAGMSILGASGFGERAAFTYAVLLNNAMLTISMGDDRLQHEGDGPRDHATMMTEFAEMTAGSAPAKAMGRELIQPFAEGGDAAEQLRWEYYRSAVNITIAGIEVTSTPPEEGVHEWQGDVAADSHP